MENFNALFEAMGSLIIQVTGNVLMSGLGWGITGFILGIILVVQCKKRQTFARSNALWSFVAKCNYVLIPIALGGLGLTQGGIMGAHNTVNEWIDMTTEPIIEYVADYLPAFQQFMNNTMTNNPDQHITLEQAVNQFNQSEATGIKQIIISNVNIGVLSAALELAPNTPASDFAEPLIMLSQTDIYNLQKKDLSVLPMTLKAVSGFYFGSVYWVFFAPFGLYFLVVFGELMFYRLIRKASNAVYHHNPDQYQFA
jgi:hypothetical protein